ncbi:MAG TPA: hypothetical protein VGL26_08830 [Jatrophihabitans sp.]|jgi:hypothetical protein
MAGVDIVLANAGLCAECAHVLVRPTAKGTVYLRCGLAATEPRLPRYPRLPVLQCIGFAGPSDDTRAE